MLNIIRGYHFHKNVSYWLAEVVSPGIRLQQLIFIVCHLPGYEKIEPEKHESLMAAWQQLGRISPTGSKQSVIIMEVCFCRPKICIMFLTFTFTSPLFKPHTRGRKPTDYLRKCSIVCVGIPNLLLLSIYTRSNKEPKYYV